MDPKTKEYITTDMITVGFMEGLEDAYIKMRDHKIRHLPVVDSKKKIIGIISDRDIQRGMNTDVRDYESFRITSADFDPSARVWDYMSAPVKCVPFETDLKTISQRMIDEKI